MQTSEVCSSCQRIPGYNPRETSSVLIRLCSRGILGVVLHIVPKHTEPITASFTSSGSQNTHVRQLVAELSFSRFLLLRLARRSTRENATAFAVPSAWERDDATADIIPRTLVEAKINKLLDNKPNVAANKQTNTGEEATQKILT